MELVYIFREADEDRFTVGASKDLQSRKNNGPDRWNPRLKLYKTLKTPDHFSLEKFLHNELAEKRVTDTRSESWYAATSAEIDEAIMRAETLGKNYIANKKKVAELKNVETDGTWVGPNERLQGIHDRLAVVLQQKNAICREEAMLKIEAMACIGNADGVDGLFHWHSESRRAFQTKIFAKQHPDLYEAFKEETFVRKFKLWSGIEEDCEEDILIRATMSANI